MHPNNFKNKLNNEVRAIRLSDDTIVDAIMFVNEFQPESLIYHSNVNECEIYTLTGWRRASVEKHDYICYDYLTRMFFVYPEDKFEKEFSICLTLEEN